jgi:hypothetical protein
MKVLYGIMISDDSEDDEDEEDGITMSRKAETQAVKAKIDKDEVLINY